MPDRIDMQNPCQKTYGPVRVSRSLGPGRAFLSSWSVSSLLAGGDEELLEVFHAHLFAVEGYVLLDYFEYLTVEGILGKHLTLFLLFHYLLGIALYDLLVQAPK